MSPARSSAAQPPHPARRASLLASPDPSLSLSRQSEILRLSPAQPQEVMEGEKGSSEGDPRSLSPASTPLV